MKIRYEYDWRDGFCGGLACGGAVNLVIAYVFPHGGDVNVIITALGSALLLYSIVLYLINRGA